ncbi:hypothetical protein D0C16_21210 [Cellvibrio sp. KY-GH-1]|uniref:hypothetical protein n=1 Tax=Cellvibrio sp. KY-GH-1 TaxID=2303332 RepID=UPI00124808A8|nr:hypothetical protein [Cellvibrio sp. KY-GH-1]QEY18283.1 hypothetical protein D0C16_21210 [Cellvibrio sp. KY-GH-1]
MDNIVFPPPFPTSLVIKLDQLQYTFYQKSCLEIRSPSGQVLTVICKPLPAKTDEDAAYQLWAQACLLEVLFDQVNERIKLPPRAINSIAYVIERIDGHLKRQAVS